MKDQRIAHIRVTLEDVEPTVIRRFTTPLSLRLDRLHLALQSAMGWTNSHLWVFEAEAARWIAPAERFEGEDGLDAAKTTLAEALAACGDGPLRYIYDLGDGWTHRIDVEKIEEPTPDMLSPSLLSAVGRCPPEDVGGPPGYEAFLEAIRDPSHPDHDDALLWSPWGVFDPEDPEIETLQVSLKRLAKQWSRRPPARKKK